ncbi:MAG: SH3 domain-containing protein [Saprospiraceae bacterium]|nr:SH3 domain-containing protein [Saprospiraceae bacterium]
MKHVWLLFFALCWIACKNDQAPNNTVTEAPAPTQTPTSTPSPEPVANEETRDQPVIAQDDHSKATITGSNVTMRKEASIQSEKIGSFTAAEKVEVLESKNVNNDKEAMLTKAVTLQGSGGEITLTKGKAVIIEEYQSERNFYAVSYEDPQKGKLTADIPADAIETISYSTWYRVKKANGEIGWVLGKFLKN